MQARFTTVDMSWYEDTFFTFYQVFLSIHNNHNKIVVYLITTLINNNQSELQ